jgi:putative ABC transport system permease protein
MTTPAWLASIASAIRGALTVRSTDEDFTYELESHLDLLTREYVAAGMTREDAERAARIRLGGITQLQETNRELRGLPFLETVFQDSRYAVRAMRRNPSFSIVAVLTLALGIGANTAIFSVVRAVVLKPLPYAEPEQLFNVYQQRLKDETAKTGWSYRNFDELRRQNPVFSEMAGSQFHQLTLTGHGEPSVVNTSVVTPELFSLLGVKPLLGRTLRPDDGKAGAEPVVVLSEALWRSSFGGDSAIVGRSLDLDKRSFTVVGIMPATFRFPLGAEREQLWIPLARDPLFGSWMAGHGGHWLRVTGRLKPGMSKSRALAELGAIAARLARDFPDENREWTIGMIPLQELIVGNVKPALFVLSGAVALVLLIACANLASLLLARAASRAREIAVRTTLGARRSRIVRQLLTEAVVLGLVGGAAGIVVAYVGVQALSSLLPATVPRVNAIRVDYVVLAFGLVVSIVASCGFGLAPAFFAANANVRTGLREGGRSGTSSTGRVRSVLAAAEVALAMVLLVAAGLLIRSFAKLTSVQPGFDAQRLVKAEISLPQFEYSTPRQWVAFADELLAGIQTEPGLQNAAITVPMPLADGYVNLGFDIVGEPAAVGTAREANYASVSPGYFRLMGIPLLAGRWFGERDTLSAPRVSVISSRMAQLYFPNRNPIGQRIAFGLPPDSGAAREIVGVVGDVRDVALGNAPGPMMYAPFAQSPLWGAGIVVRSTLDVASAAAGIRRQVAKIDKDLPVSDVATMSDVIDGSVAQPRFRTILLALFAAMALVTAATGIFGVISYSVSCRTNEIGIRVALGASRSAILAMISRETAALTLSGVAVGIPCALAASRLVAHMLFGISAHDPWTLAAVVAALLGVSALAAYVPARRAIRVDPMDALRHE